MSEWYEECKKPMGGKIGKEIVKLAEENIICTSNVSDYAENLAKKHKVKKDFVISEICRHHDFHNAWSGDEKYTHYDKKEPYNLQYIQGAKDDRHWYSENKITNPKEMSAFIRGYHTASGNCYDRYNNLMLLLMTYLEQEK